jgi:hypothetical protein
MLHFHCLVVSAGLARLWIPAFAGMTMRTKVAGMGAPKKILHQSSDGMGKKQIRSTTVFARI